MACRALCALRTSYINVKGPGNFRPLRYYLINGESPIKAQRAIPALALVRHRQSAWLLLRDHIPFGVEERDVAEWRDLVFNFFVVADNYYCRAIGIKVFRRGMLNVRQG